MALKNPDGFDLYQLGQAPPSLSGKVATSGFDFFRLGEISPLLFPSFVSKPINTVAPVISGSPTVSALLTSTPGTWTG